MKKNIVGLSGGIGSGKTSATDLLAMKGVPIIDADVVARQVVEPNALALQTICERYGSNILKDDNSLDRAALRDIIFQDTTQKQWLESLLHPIIRDEILQQLAKASAQSPYVILSSPLLLETDQHLLTQCIVIVDIDRQIQIQRAMLRDDNTQQQIERIIDNQLDRESRLAKADFVIDNSASFAHLKDQVAQVHQQLLLKFSDTSSISAS